MNEVDHDGDGDAAAGGLGGHAVDLMPVAVDQYGPGPQVIEVARSASSKTWPITTWAESATLAVSHCPRPPGGLGSGPAGGDDPFGVRATGAAS